jgi:hypothetical protein
LLRGVRLCGYVWVWKRKRGNDVMNDTNIKYFLLVIFSIVVACFLSMVYKEISDPCFSRGEKYIVRYDKIGNSIVPVYYADCLIRESDL